ncbi:MAG: hypothetical protein RIB43_09715 [Rhodospirillaceae bacterium]
MQIVHQGFDGLDVTFQGQLPDAFMDILEEAQLRAQDDGKNALTEYNGVFFHVERSGAVGGYKFRCDTGPSGAKWFFKDTRKRNKDPWNIRVSCHSLSLASLGLGRVRADIYEFLNTIEALLPINAERISRVDYAVDFFAPEFELDADAFVMHARYNRETNEELRTGNGTSGRLGSIRIGKSPGLQAVMYDKRAEIIAKSKLYWWKVWEDNGLPSNIDRKKPEASRVWRVELRAGSNYLRRKWGVNSWIDLHEKGGDVLLSIADRIRYAQTSQDENRSRWKNNEIWDRVILALKDDLFELTSNSTPNDLKEVMRDEHLRMMKSQTIGLLANWLNAAQVQYEDETDLSLIAANIIRSAVDDETARFIESMEKAKKRYVFLES